MPKGGKMEVLSKTQVKILLKENLDKELNLIYKKLDGLYERVCKLEEEIKITKLK